MTPIEPQAASSAILERNGRLLLVRRKNPPSADMLAFPGGRAEPGETPDQTALRELREETGIIAHSPELFATFDLKQHGPDGRVTSHFFLSVFFVQETGEMDAIAADDALSLGWFTHDDVLSLNAPDSVKDCVLRLKRKNNI